MLNENAWLNQIIFKKNNNFIAFKILDWILEFQKLLIMFLFDFKKSYAIIEWNFLDEFMLVLRFKNQWIRWIKILYVDFWYTIELNCFNNIFF